MLWKTSVPESFFNKKETQAQVNFAVNFAKFLGTPSLQNISERLFLYEINSALLN